MTTEFLWTLSEFRSEFQLPTLVANQWGDYGILQQFRSEMQLQSFLLEMANQLYGHIIIMEFLKNFDQNSVGQTVEEINIS